MWAVFFILVLLIPLLAVVLDSPVGKAAARWIEGRGAAVDDARLKALEAEVERMGRELERLREQSEFLARLLEERSEEKLPPGDAGA